MERMTDDSEKRSGPARLFYSSDQNVERIDVGYYDLRLGPDDSRNMNLGIYHSASQQRAEKNQLGDIQGRQGQTTLQQYLVSPRQNTLLNWSTRSLGSSSISSPGKAEPKNSANGHISLKEGSSSS
jgi:hypothetical protein